jgi:hypothetical protein
MISVKKDIYREKLIALLEGLECKNVQKLVMEETPESLQKIGKEISRRAKIVNDFLYDRNYNEPEYPDSYFVEERY